MPALPDHHTATRGTVVGVEGAGDHPHDGERPDDVHAAVASFLATLEPDARAGT